MKTKFREIIYRILGLNYNHLLKIVDFVYLSEDKYTNIGYRTYNNGAKVYRWSNASLTIGKFCSIARDVNFIMDDANHSIGNITNFPLCDNLFHNNELIGNSSKDSFLTKHRKKMGITIGNDVWIGMGSTILPGIVIGDGATIASGSVVTTSIPSYCVAGGVPAKIIKHKCTEQEKHLLEAISWWDWDDKVIKLRIFDFINLSVSEFINKYNNLR